MAEKLLIADFSGGTGYLSGDGAYSRSDKAVGMDFAKDTLKKIAARDNIENTAEYLSHHLKEADEALEKIIRDERLVKNAQIPKVLIDIRESRRKHGFSQEHINYAHQLADFFYGAGHLTQGAIFKAEEAISFLMNNQHSEAQDAFYYAKIQWPIRDMIFRWCIESNRALSFALQGKYEEANELYSKLAVKFKTFYDSSEESERKCIEDLSGINLNNTSLIHRQNEPEKFLSVKNIYSFIPMILLEDELAEALSTTRIYLHESIKDGSFGMKVKLPAGFLNNTVVLEPPKGLEKKTVSFDAPDIPSAMRAFLKEKR